MESEDRSKLEAIATLLLDMLRSDTVKPAYERTPSAEQLIAMAKAKISARRRRQELFPGIQVADPAWDLLLELYVNSVEGRQISVTGLGLGANVPGATVLRWLSLFQEAGLIVREPDSLDRRRIWVRLTALGVDRVAKGIAASEIPPSAIYRPSLAA
ncbi:winged helix-turn-helix transcriptional regulator [Novosphingobium sp. ERN07]|uniref:MarR family winged helix-turn-helix transcriptional regulator n=1 Tax=Novosphingobium sp. ERN07 TaxID=2726187 RepID=UPI001456792A|nr:MarR family winged helix-turn-helix transcriptional regulator [Novosphingobium sp. ERN07]NLR72564.1 winged helix-turn-helix transcriptional regulator [Novosphingobium sp. ERN07]